MAPSFDESFGGDEKKLSSLVDIAGAAEDVAGTSSTRSASAGFFDGSGAMVSASSSLASCIFFQQKLLAGVKERESDLSFVWTVGSARRQGGTRLAQKLFGLT